MFDGRQGLRTIAGFGAIGMVAFGAACAHVGEEEFQAEIDMIRQEMAEGDRAVAERVDATDRRVDDLEARLNAVETELRALEEELDLELERLENSLRVHLPVHFAFDDDRIETGQQPVLDRVGGVLMEYYPGAILTVEGLTDPSGSAEYNMRLGQRRAESVKGYLVDRIGWQENRVRAVSYGESLERLVDPNAQGPGETGRVNRRAVIVIEHAQDVQDRPVVGETD